MSSCGDEPENEADRLGVGAACAVDTDCQDTQSCLLDFKGGYCGIKACKSDADCPEVSACVAHDDGSNYCFRTCTDKPQCNANRAADNESNCSSSVVFTDAETNKSVKACVPPSN